MRNRTSITVLEPSKRYAEFALRSIAGLAIILASAASAAAQTVVWGTGDPNLDVPAVQAAVDQGGNVILKGHFSFNRPPTIPTDLPALPTPGGYPPATVLISKAVTISGAQDQDGEMTTVDGGTIPFYVKAPGASVTIQALSFVRPTTDAILVYAVGGLNIAYCKVEGIVPLANTSESSGIEIDTIGNIPSPTSPGKPENVSGTLRVVNNDIDMTGGAKNENTLGITVFSVGVPGAEVEAYVAGNKIRNTTEPAINFRRIVGRAYVERNVLTTGTVTSVSGPEVIRVANIGSYLIAHNSIDCLWADPAAKGIGVFSQFAAWPIEYALVADNDVNMEAPEGTVFVVPGSAGIDIRGFAQGNAVRNNTIQGHAGAALSVDAFKGGFPNNNAFVLDHFDDFEASVADVFVGPDVLDTLVVEPGTIADQGTGTVILPVTF